MKRGETGDTSEQVDTFLKMSTAEHHGRFTEIFQTFFQTFCKNCSEYGKSVY